MTRFLQANMHRSRLADQLLPQLASEVAADLLLLSEQYRDRESPSWYTDVSGTAAIWVLDNSKVRVAKHGQGNGFVWVSFEGNTVFSVYLTPNEPIQSFRDRVDRLEDAILNAIGRVLVGGDFNARAIEWGMSESDTRGKYLLDMAARTGLFVLNVGSISTFRRPGYTETIPDVTFAAESLVPLVRRWRVLENYTASDHQYISFELADRVPLTDIHRPTPRRWNAGCLDARRFAEIIANGFETEEYADGRDGVEAFVNSTMALITNACDASMPRTFHRRGKPPVYWWTAEIADLRRRCHRLRRIAQRARNRDDAHFRSAEHKSARKDLRRAINRSKVRCWQELVDDVNRDPWGLGYKVVTKKLGSHGSTCLIDADAIERMVGTLFPTHPIRREEADLYVEDLPIFTVEELERNVCRMKDKKAPGPDGIPCEVLKLVCRQHPTMMLDLYNACLRSGVFPHRWKIARLVLISKGKGDPESPSAYRPLCMLDTAGKLLERLIKSRLRTAIHDAGDFSPNQYGFRAGRSTVDAVLEVVRAVQQAEDHSHSSRRVVLLVTLDVRNAFNSARWVDMLGALEHSFRVPAYLLRMLRDYLKDRSLLFDTREGQRSVEVTSGAAQGSILGPDLWNAAYDSLLRAEMPDECSLVGYADDIAALVAARTVEQAQLRLNILMHTVSNWMAEHGLSLALNKTEVVLLTKKRIPTVFPVRVGGEVVASKNAVKYLGLMVDSKLSFTDQIQRTADKASRSVSALSRLMANVGGPSSSKRRLLMSAVQSVLLYGAEVWADALNRDTNRKKLAQVQRRGALRVASAYRTVSEPAALVIAGVIPIDLLAKERKAVFLRRSEEGREAIAREERTRTLRAWQRSWEEESRSRWTAILIAEIEPWVTRKFGEVGYYVTQFLTSHGYFRSYLYKIGKATSAECLYCPGEVDNARHTFFTCGRWYDLRQELYEGVGYGLRPENIIGAMLQGADTWARVTHYVRAVLVAKKADLDRL